MDEAKQKLNGWKHRTLSRAARFLLMKTSLAASIAMLCNLHSFPRKL